MRAIGEIAGPGDGFAREERCARSECAHECVCRTSARTVRGAGGDTRQSEVETPQYQLSSFNGVSKAGNPLSEIMMEQRFELLQSNITQSGSSVNRNVQPNELAGGVDLATMSTTPAGFNAYSFVLKDAAFYEPKEVYKNQRTVDNERVLRGLTRGSDSLHQQMVDQQYKIGN